MADAAPPSRDRVEGYFTPGRPRILSPFSEWSDAGAQALAPLTKTCCWGAGKLPSPPTSRIERFVSK